MALTSFDSNPSCMIFALMKGASDLWDYSSVLFIIVSMIGFLSLVVFEDLLWLTTAISRNLTVRELQNIWAHKHCFDIKSPGDEDDQEAAIESNSYFVHKSFSLISMIRNLMGFCTGHYKKAKTVSKRVRVKRNYSDIRNASSRSTE